MTSTQPTYQKQRRGLAAGHEFRDDVLHGLRAQRKRLHCKYFYDQRGSELFDRICRLEEYYLTRTELHIMRRYGGAMGQRLGRDAMVIELGSGSSVKTRILLDHLQSAVAYCPVDISRNHLLKVAADLSREYPELEVLPIVADFVQPFSLPSPGRIPSAVTVYFPGSTIGNFQPNDAAKLLAGIRELCQPTGGLLIGIDLQKDAAMIEAAYNDSEGVTERFNLNLLQRINRELDADFDIDQFRHQAFYDTERTRMDISLVSRSRQTVKVAGETFDFEPGEAIHTEYSHKYTVNSFASLAAGVGFSLRDVWTDERDYFAVLYLDAVH
jgi:dimethylhistidine N-methyltransferase